MAFGDYAIDVGDLTEAQVRYYRKRPVKSQFTRLGKTARWFNPKGYAMHGKSFEFFVMTQPATPVRREQFNTAAAAAFPIPRPWATKELSVTHGDLRNFQAAIKYNELEEMKNKDRATALYDLAAKSVEEMDQDFASQLNLAIHQDGSCEMATVSQIYDVDGTAFSGSAGSAPAYIAITGGPISAFSVGDVLQIIDTGDDTTVNVICIVLDVIHGPDGPWSAGTRVADIGPGIIVDTCDASGDRTAGGNWGAVADPAAGDHIARYGEYHATAASQRNIHGFGDWFDTTVDVYRDSDGGSVLDREAAGNHWMNPEIFDYASGGAVTFDIDTHLVDYEATMPTRVSSGRKKRPSMWEGKVESSEEGIVLPEMLLAIGEPGLIRTAINSGSATHQFTAAEAFTRDAAEKRGRIAVEGFEGLVWHSATVGPIAFEADEASVPNKLRIIVSDSFFWVLFGAKEYGAVQWATYAGNSRFQRISDSNGSPTYYITGGAWTAAQLSCDQIGANAEIRGVKP